MKKSKKMLSALIIILIVLSCFSNSFAAKLNTRLDVIKQASETKYLENDQGYISKTIVDLDPDKGEVTVDLSLSNLTKNQTEEKEKYDNTEVYIMIPENIALDGEKFNQYITYIEALSNKVFEKNSQTKIGIIGIQGPIRDRIKDENGNLLTGEKDESNVKGSESNAEIVVALTNNTSVLKSGLENMNTSKVDYYTNLQAAVKLAENSYSNNVNKILISLFDNVPQTAIGECERVTYGGFLSKYKTAEEAVTAKNQSLVDKTKTEILELEKLNINFILLRPDDTSYDQVWYSLETGEKILDFDGSPYVKELYGTLESPTYGKMYSLNNDDLEKIVTEYIYQDIIEEIRVDIKSAVIKEYFSEEILENFDITFSDENIDSTKISENGYITWNVGNVKGNKTVNLQYTLKIKDMKNKELLNKVISTSKKTELTYINHLDVNTIVESTSSPQIRLTEVKEVVKDETKNEIKDTNTPKEDTTIAPNNKLPNAGARIAILIGLISLIVIMIYYHTRYRVMKKMKF